MKRDTKYKNRILNLGRLLRGDGSRITVIGLVTRKAGDPLSAALGHQTSIGRWIIGYKS
jgi:hypothetical protein